MAWYDFLFQSNSKLQSSRRVSPSLGGRALAGGRVSFDTEEESWTAFGSFFAVEEPDDPETNWRTYQLDAKTLSRMAPHRLIKLLSDLSPELSRALFDFITLCVPGWNIKVFSTDSDDIDAEGQMVVNEFMSLLTERYGSLHVPFSTMFLGLFTRGALCAELVLNEDITGAIDLATPDPYSIRFRKISDPMRNVIYIPGQWQDGEWISLDRPTFRYIPLHKFPGSPFGRSMASPALFSAIFALALLHDVRRVIAQQGWPRIHISVDIEKLVEAMPSSVGDDDDTFYEWINSVISEIQTAYSSLEPEDAYVTSSVVNLNNPIGAIDASSLGAFDSIISSIERFLVRALKTMPLLMAMNEGATETHANRQWEIMATAVKNAQHLFENMMEYFLEIVLRVNGLQGRVEFKLAQVRAIEELRDAQTESLKIRNAWQKYLAGWITIDQASEEVTGSKAVLESPVALTMPPSVGSDPMELQSEPGSTKSKTIINRNIEGKGDQLPIVPIEISFTPDDLNGTYKRWDAAMEDYERLWDATVIEKR